MASITINSSIHGVVEFFIHSEGGYIWGEWNNGHRFQLCKGGNTMGSTLTATSATLERTARNWWKRYLAADRQYR